MRVISGKYRGRRLNSPINDAVRPTADKVKESIFNVIQFDVEDCVFVDLFAGSGGMGIEALSRGAKSVVFSDSDREAVRLVNSNLKGIDGDFKVLNRDYRDVLYGLSGKCDFIFADPPYKTDYIEDICRIVKERNLLANGGYVIYEHAEDKADYVLPDGMFIAKRKQFGIVVVDYIAYSRGRTAVAGSYDPITKGHIDVIEAALKDYDELTVLIAKNEDKQYLFSLEERKLFCSLAVEDYLNVKVDVCDGYVYEYCKAHGIDTVYRGYRDDKDLIYEQDMAKFNEEHGLKTVLVEGVRAVSSSLIREGLSGGEDIKKYLPKNCVKAVMKAYKEKV